MDYMHTLFCFLFECSANHATGSSQSSEQVGSSYYSEGLTMACGRFSGPVAASLGLWQHKRGNACDLEAGP